MAEAFRDPPSSGTSIDEQRVINALEANIVEADTIQGSEISEQRQRNHVMYAIDKIGNEKSGRSHHISADVLDAVESQKAYYQEAFTSNRIPVRFRPENNQDKLARLGTEYVNKQFMEKNDGYALLRDSFHDAFVAKRCVFKVEWRPDTELKTEPFEGMTQAQVMQAEARPDIVAVDILKKGMGPNGVPVFSGTIDREEDIGYVDVELTQPERFFRDPNVSFINEAAFAGYQEDLSRWELIDQGYDPDEVSELNLDYRFRQNEEDAARKAHDSTWSRARRHKRPAEQEIVTVYHHWAYMDLSQYMNGEQEAETKLYKFTWSAGRLLTIPETMDEDGVGEYYKEETDGMPFFEWTQYKISHAEFGLCEADIMGDLQWTKSNLRRLIIDNQAMGNTSRWKARHGFIKNPRELLDNNIGSVLWVKDMQALEPLETPPVSPVSFNLLETLDVEKENRNGLSRLAKGLSGDAVSHQNADSMIQRLTNASNRRVLRGVRDYAETLLKPMFLHMYNLGVKYDQQVHHVDINGQWVPLQPSQWPKRSKVHVQVSLTPDEGREKGMFLMQMHAMMKDDPDIAKMYGIKEKHAMMNDLFELMNAGDASRYMAHPASEEFKQKIMQEQQMQQMQQGMMQMEQRMKQMELQLKVREQNRKDGDTATDNLLEEEKFEHEKYMDVLEAGIEITQKRPAEV